MMKKSCALLLCMVFLFGSCAKQGQPADQWDKKAICYTQAAIPPQTTVAVIDSGTNVESESILQGYNILDGTNNVKDITSHGTCVTSKLLDLYPSLSIIPIKVTDDPQNIQEQDFVAGIKKATELGVAIIHISIGTLTDYPAVRDAIAHAIAQNILIIAAAGNQQQDSLSYPAAYDGVLSVMARNRNNVDMPNNNKSIYKKSFSAPGETVDCANGMKSSGSSIAAVYITAAAALLQSGNPTMKPAEIHAALIRASQFGTDYSYGMINFSKLFPDEN